VLVTNCSIYCPTPSLCSMLVNHFKFRQDVQSYHLGGMGCGNGVMAFSLLRDLLQVGAELLVGGDAGNWMWRLWAARRGRGTCSCVTLPMWATGSGASGWPGGGAAGR
jgi:hypothetical protein